MIRTTASQNTRRTSTTRTGAALSLCFFKKNLLSDGKRRLRQTGYIPWKTALGNAGELINSQKKTALQKYSAAKEPYEFLRWHYPNQVSGRGANPPLSPFASSRSILREIIVALNGEKVKGKIEPVYPIKKPAFLSPWRVRPTMSDEVFCEKMDKGSR